MAYFSNSSSGEVLNEQCADCPLGYGWNDPAQQELFDREAVPRPCPVALVQLTYNYKQIRSGGCDATADYLESLQGVPAGFKPKKDCGAAITQVNSAIEHLRSDDFQDAMNLLINEEGECLVRRELLKCRKDGDEL